MMRRGSIPTIREVTCRSPRARSRTLKGAAPHRGGEVDRPHLALEDRGQNVKDSRLGTEEGQHEVERLLLDEVHRLLAKAFPLEPRLDYPWRAWAEVVEHLGADDAMSRQVRDRAAREPDDTAPIGYRRAFVRWLGRILSTLVFLLGYFWMLWDADNQCWHDKLARTLVVKTN